MTTDPTNPDAATAADPTLLARLQQAAELLEAVAADPALLHALPEAEQKRLKAAAGKFFNPDPAAYREAKRQKRREAAAQRVAQEEAILHESGIRELRRRPVFTTPNVFPP